jgi:hypothetical protein
MIGDNTVRLTPWEWLACVDVAGRRMSTSFMRPLNHASTYQRTHSKRLHEETLGAAGEMAFCKWANVYWSPSVDTFHYIPDASTCIEIRATDRDPGTSACSLIVRDNDPPDRWYYLVTQSPADSLLLTVQGGIRGLDARRDEWRSNPHGHRESWFVPVCALTQPRRRATG